MRVKIIIDKGHVFNEVFIVWEGRCEFAFHFKWMVRFSGSRIFENNIVDTSFFQKGVIDYIIVSRFWRGYIVSPLTEAWGYGFT